MSNIPSSVTKRPRIRHFLKKCWMPLAVVIIILAIIFSLFRALTPWAKQYKTEVEQHLSVILGQPVTINDMETSWYWFVPVLKLKDVSISDSQEHVLQLKKLLVGINLFGSLWHWQIQPGILYIEDAKLTIHQVDDQWDIDGLTQEERKMTLASASYLPMLAWLLEQQKIVIKHVDADMHLNDGTFIPIRNINLTIANHHGHYRMKGNAHLQQDIPTDLMVLADMQINAYELKKAKGHFYFSLKQFVPLQWHEFLPTLPVALQEGHGDIEAWLDFRKGKLSSLQTKLDFQDVVWHEYGKKTPQYIQTIRANTAWKMVKSGWQLDVDDLALTTNGFVWPDNALKITYHAAEDAYRIYAQTLLISPLLQIDLDWPESFKSLLTSHVSGELYDAQVTWHQGQLTALLTRFANLSWKRYQAVPGMDHLSGVLSWQPSQGRLELDGEAVSITAKHMPKLILSQLNTALEWQQTPNDTLQVNVKRFVMMHPKLLVNATATLTDYQKDNPGALQLDMAFSMEDATSWIPYIPNSALKPKLYEWLHKDVRKIDKATGELKIHGPLAVFPFDHQEGEFSVKSYLQGVDLRFAPRWPMTRQIDAYLNVHQRTLEADIMHALLKTLESNQIHLIVNHLGLKERLLVHGQINAPAQDMMTYVLASPLRLKLKKLNHVVLHGPLALDLNLDVPLFPEDNNILVRGQLAFNENQISFKQMTDDASLNAVDGILNFDQDGATNSALSAQWFGKPVNIAVRAVQKPAHFTEIKADTVVPVSRIKKSFRDLALVQKMHGVLDLHGVWELAHDPKHFDHINIRSSLTNVVIDLPPPFGKTKDDRAPVVFDFDFLVQDGFRLRFDYRDRLNADVWINEVEDKYSLNRGEFFLGKGRARLARTPGLVVHGVLPEFDWDIWKKALADGKASRPDWMDQLRFVDIKLEHLKYLRQDFQDSVVSLQKENKDTWLMKIQQKQVAGTIHYQMNNHTVSGQFDHLYLDQSLLLSDKDKSSHSALNPKDIPNLDLDIRDFRVSDNELGQMILKSRTKDDLWELSLGELKTPFYDLSLQGKWTKRNEINETEMTAKLHVSNLAKTLECIHISPVIDAHSGDIQFQGGWPSGIDSFSLPKVNGHLDMVLKDGWITHFSKETEQKLGLGKLLSVLSLQTIPRRLKLDFSDLARDGYSFDIVKGSFVMKKGVMTTQDSYVDGPIAHVTMKGDLDVVLRQYQLTLRVSPYITSSLPVVATIAGGPIAGVATLVVSKIISDQMQKVSGYTYQITGPWSSPNIQQIQTNKKALPMRMPQRS